MSQSSYTNMPRRCDGCQAPIALPRHTRTLRCPQYQQLYAHARGKAQSALRYVKLKAEGLWPTCLIERCDSEAKNGAAGRTVRPMHNEALVTAGLLAGE